MPKRTDKFELGGQMAGRELRAEEVDRLREKLTNDLVPPLADEERELLLAIFSAASDSVMAVPGSERTILTRVELENDEIRQLLEQLLSAFTPGESPGAVTQVNIFSKIHPGDGT
jgi:hypothetical protein